MQIYNDEHLYHHGVLGMHWGKRKVQQLKKYNDDYKIKINKIANSKSAHKADVEIAERANATIGKKVLNATFKSASSTLLKDIITGGLREYDIGSKDFLKKKVLEVGKNAVKDIITNELLARSVADKYDKEGKRVKGSNNSLFTREQVVTSAISAARIVGPWVKTYGYMKMAQMHTERQAGEAAFNRWGDKILTDKVSDYSNIIPNVNYSVS